MAFAMLKGLGAPEEVSSCKIDAPNQKLISAQGCSITAINSTAEQVTFTREDQGLPLNLGILSGLNYRWIPIPEQLNRYTLQISNLADRQFEIRVEGRLLGKVSAAQLAKGINIASMTADPWEPGGPWDAQSDVLKELVEARDKLWMSETFRSNFDPANPAADQLHKRILKLDQQLIQQQRAQAKPYPYHFEIRTSAP
jgi:hypothetical protein